MREGRLFTIESFKGSDLRKELMVFLGEQGFIRFDEYADPTYVGVEPNKALWPTPICNFRSWKDDPIVVSSNITVNPQDPRDITFGYNASDIVNVRTTRLFFECIGKHKVTGLQEVLFYGTVDLVR